MFQYYNDFFKIWGRGEGGCYQVRFHQVRSLKVQTCCPLHNILLSGLSRTELVSFLLDIELEQIPRCEPTV